MCCTRAAHRSDEVRVADGCLRATARAPVGPQAGGSGRRRRDRPGPMAGDAMSDDQSRAGVGRSGRRPFDRWRLVAPQGGGGLAAPVAAQGAAASGLPEHLHDAQHVLRALVRPAGLPGPLPRGGCPHRCLGPHGHRRRLSSPARSEPPRPSASSWTRWPTSSPSGSPRGAHPHVGPADLAGPGLGCGPACGWRVRPSDWPAST